MMCNEEQKEMGTDKRLTNAMKLADYLKAENQKCQDMIKEKDEKLLRVMKEIEDF